MPKVHTGLLPTAQIHVVNYLCNYLGLPGCRVWNLDISEEKSLQMRRILARRTLAYTSTDLSKE